VLLGSNLTMGCCACHKNHYCVLYSLYYGLHTLTAVPRSIQTSTYYYYFFIIKNAKIKVTLSHQGHCRGTLQNLRKTCVGLYLFSVSVIINGGCRQQQSTEGLMSQASWLGLTVDNQMALFYIHQMN